MENYGKTQKTRLVKHSHNWRCASIFNTFQLDDVLPIRRTADFPWRMICNVGIDTAGYGKIVQNLIMWEYRIFVDVLFHTRLLAELLMDGKLSFLNEKTHTFLLNIKREALALSSMSKCWFLMAFIISEAVSKLYRFTAAPDGNSKPGTYLEWRRRFRGT